MLRSKFMQPPKSVLRGNTCFQFHSCYIQLAVNRQIHKIVVCSDDCVMIVFFVQTSRELKVSGCIGPCIAMDNKSASVSEIQIGVSGTTQWKTCGLYPNTTFALYFEVHVYFIYLTLFCLFVLWLIDSRPTFEILGLDKALSQHSVWPVSSVFRLWTSTMLLYHKEVVVWYNSSQHISIQPDKNVLESQH